MQPDAATLATAHSMGATHITYYARHWALERDVWKVYRQMDCLAGNRWHVAFIGYRDNPRWQITASEPTTEMAIDGVRQMELFG